MPSPILFRSTDTGAPAGPSSTAGTLLTALNGCLIINSLFTAVSGAAFVDHTLKARSQATAANAGTFALFQGPTVTVDEAYFGLSSRFDRLKLKLATPGVQNAAVTLAWEYWNGTAWTALTVADGTTGLTADGSVTWTIPSDWATRAVNSVTVYWVRVRFTAGSWTTNPLVQYATITGWTQAYGPTGNICAYQQGGGNLVFFEINDNGPGAGTTKEARLVGYETMSALSTGTGPFPTTALTFIRKSVATPTDATARAYTILADDRTCYLFISSGDLAGRYYGHAFGDIYSLVPNDSYRNIVAGQATENSATSAQCLAVLHSTMTQVQAGKYMDRAYTGLGGGISVGFTGDVAKSSSGTSMNGTVQFPNGADGGLWLSPVWINEASATLRGRLRGFWYPLHAIANFTDGDTFSGSGVYAGKTFVVVKAVADNAGAANSVVVLETSNTWDTN